MEANTNLMMQSIHKLEALDFKFQIITMQSLLEEPIVADVVILNAYDVLISGQPYEVRPKCLRGLWDLRGKRVFAFSATSSPSHEILLNACIREPKVLAFKSEYEMVHGASPVIDPSMH